MARNRIAFALALGLMLLAIVADQASKAWVREFFNGRDPVAPFGDYFILVSAWNPGVSFSLFASSGKVGVIFFGLLAVVVSVGLLVWLWLRPQRLRFAPVGMIAGGALSNAIDRVQFGAVYDFLYFHYGEWGWPAFNLADSLIVVGAGWLLLLDLMQSKKNPI